VQSVQEGTKIQGLHLTDPQYREVQKALALMKERQAIAPDTYTKARQKAYQISDKGREAKKLYNISNKCKETKKLYHTSDKYKEAKKRHNASDKGKETFKRYFASKKGREAKKLYKTSDKGRKTDKRYRTSDKGREAFKRYQISNKGTEAFKRYKTSDKGIEANKRYNASDKGREARKRYREKLKDPRQQKARLEHKINRENEEYRQKMQELDQQLHNALATWPLPRAELQHWHATKQQLEQEWKTIREGHQKALQRADALVQCYNELSALVEAFPSPPHQQALGSMPQEHAWVLEEASHDEAFETSERFQELYNHLRSLLEPSPSVSHLQELRPTEPAATQPSAFERLMRDYDHVSEQLEVYLQEFAAPDNWQQRNTLDF
jgi:DNA-binding PadR family transcriptional regulator